MEDESIIALYWQRDSRAISETDGKYGALCRSISRGIVRSREDAEECVNDTYLAAWNAIPPQRPRRFGAYICAVVRNISVSRVRQSCLKRRGGGEYTTALDELDECRPRAPRGAARACRGGGHIPLRALSRRAENIHVPVLARRVNSAHGGDRRLFGGQGQDLAAPHEEEAEKAS